MQTGATGVLSGQYGQVMGSPQNVHFFSQQRPFQFKMNKWKVLAPSNIWVDSDTVDFLPAGAAARTQASRQACVQSYVWCIFLLT